MEKHSEIQCDKKDCIHFEIFLECCNFCKWNKKVKSDIVTDDYFNKVKKTGY